MKMPGNSVTSCAVLLLVFIALSGLGPASSQSWAEFERKHIDNRNDGTRNDYCTTRIRRLNLYLNPASEQECKPKNTFIHADPSVVEALCKGVTSHRVVTSKRKYRVTSCSLVNEDETPPDCNYEGRNIFKTVRVTCERRVPVHLDGIVLPSRRG